MARKNAASRLTLKVVTGVGADGKNTYANRSIGSLSPALTDEDALAVGKGFAGLQKHGLDTVTRTDSAVLED
ncbi:DUF1659 domain-containing protein [Selenomonas sp. F0473]|uniref:DUF1659 domain-containing protein n=1 Tax=Selenomonas sp. F0473 TaxID=999423 RepID=UPI00029E84F2|nr:DUF1659 domain-containing protein [Selenomonas sp. F0473]EKU71167.1 hypothetical protein HMPREF9161_01261 [Selenomonas sp. F0473]